MISESPRQAKVPQTRTFTSSPFFYTLRCNAICLDKTTKLKCS